MGPRDPLQRQIALHIGQRVRERRIAQVPRLTVEQLAVKAGTTGSTIHRIETGKSTGTIETLEGIARALGILVEDLIYPLPSSPESAAGNRRLRQSAIYQRRSDRVVPEPRRNRRSAGDRITAGRAA